MHDPPEKACDMTTTIELPAVRHRYIDVEAPAGTVRVFFREAGPPDRPTMLLLHGFPSASHQFRRLIDALGARYHLIAPDYPGFGHTQAPRGFTYSFEDLARVMEHFVIELGIDRFVMYVFDFGGPVGFRLATRHPRWIAGLVIQNANAYDAGLSDTARAMIANRPGVPGAEARVREILAPSVTRSQYEGGTTDAELVAPDGWTLDQHFLDRPDRQKAQVALALDYHTNIELYPSWQRWLRDHQPPTLIVWGRNDPFFPPLGAHAYLRDLPDAELHTFATGHFALEDRLPEIAPLIGSFLDRIWTPDPTPRQPDPSTR
jgi:pimeloyl-ACP methyl ester carboxylesterase